MNNNMMQSSTQPMSFNATGFPELGGSGQPNT
jgi:hypothetical protein